VTDKLNPDATVEVQHKARRDDARWLGHGAILVLYGAVVAGALLVRARSRRSASPNLLDLAVIAAGILGALAVGEQLLERRAKAPTSEPLDDDDRFSHPAINVQRISFA
jgi:hypothetical protein